MTCHSERNQESAAGEPQSLYHMVTQNYAAFVRDSSCLLPIIGRIYQYGIILAQAGILKRLHYDSQQLIIPLKKSVIHIDFIQ